MKLPYKIPSMRDLEVVPKNGFKVISTFSGCGGSCLGYRMAGFEVIWANEFIKEARRTYRRNHPDSKVDKRDIRVIDPAEILSDLNMKRGQLDLLDGSPPCASFSTAGSREAGWGKVKKYSETMQRTDDLFYQYIRMIDGFRPKTFVAENVSGLLKGTAKGYFLEIFEAMEDLGYVVKAGLLDAQWLGVPQVRRRVIFIGVRKDLSDAYGVKPTFPKPFPWRYSLQEACPWIVRQGDNEGFGKGKMRKASLPSGIIGATSQTDNGKFPPSLVEVETDIERFAVGREWDRIEIGMQSDKYFNLVKPFLDQPCPTITAGARKPHAAGVVHPTEKRRLSIAEVKRICSFPDDFELTGTYEQKWERVGRAVPPLMMRAIAETVRDQILIPMRDKHER